MDKPLFLQRKLMFSSGNTKQTIATFIYLSRNLGVLPNSYTTVSSVCYDKLKLLAFVAIHSFNT